MGGFPLRENDGLLFYFQPEAYLPVSDVYSHHRAMTTCHLANIAIRLDRKLKWNPEAEMIEGDAEAKSFQSREPRKGFEINA